MAKLILSTDGEIVDEYPIASDVMTIGRHEDNEITIDCMSVSGFHTRIVTIGDEFFVEDLKSTNGTYVNSDQVVSACIKDNDIITLGSHNLKFDDSEEAPQDSDLTKVNGLDDDHAYLRIKGDNAQNSIELNGGMVTLGKTGEHVAAVTKRGSDYFCLHVDGGQDQRTTLLNGTPIPSEGKQLRTNDVVEVAGVEMEFVN